MRLYIQLKISAEINGEIIEEGQSGNEHSCGMIFNVILNLNEAFEKLVMGHLIDTDEYF